MFRVHARCTEIQHAYVRDADDENRLIMTLFQRVPLFDAYLAPSQKVLVEERDYG